MELRELVLDESLSLCTRHDAFNRLAQTDIGVSSSGTLIDELLCGNNSSRLLGALFAAREGRKKALPILLQILDEAVPQDDTTWLNMHAKVLQAIIQLDPDNSEMLLSRMLSCSSISHTWNAIVVATASIAPREQAIPFCHFLLEDRRFQAWHLDATFVLAHFGDEQATKALEQFVNSGTYGTDYIKAVVILSKGNHPKATRVLIELLRQFESLDERQRNTLYLHISNLFDLYLPPAEAARQLLDVLLRDDRSADWGQ